MGRKKDPCNESGKVMMTIDEMKEICFHCRKRNSCKQYAAVLWVEGMQKKKENNNEKKECSK